METVTFSYFLPGEYEALKQILTKFPTDIHNSILSFLSFTYEKKENLLCRRELQVIKEYTIDGLKGFVIKTSQKEILAFPKKNIIDRSYKKITFLAACRLASKYRNCKNIFHCLDRYTILTTNRLIEFNNIRSEYIELCDILLKIKQKKKHDVHIMNIFKYPYPWSPILYHPSIKCYQADLNSPLVIPIKFKY
jgi:hypothetical protein